MFQLAHAVCEFLDKGICDAFIHYKALGRHADLTLVKERAEYRRIDRPFQIRVVKHHKRRFAAKLQQATLEVFGAGLSNHAADVGRTGKVHPSDRIMGDQRFGDRSRVFRGRDQEVQHASRQTGLNERLSEQFVSSRAVL